MIGAFRERTLRLVDAGIISKVEFRMRNFGEDEATATARIAAVGKEVGGEQETRPGGDSQL